MSQETSTPSTEATAEGQTTEAVVLEDGKPTTTEVIYAGKYKSVSELEKAYGELQSTFSKKLGAFEGAPENYTIPEQMIDDPTVNFVASWGKENNLSDKGLQNLLDGYSKHQQEQIEAYQKSEIAKLGKDATDRIRNVTDWVNATAGDKADAINILAAGAKGIEALEALRNAAKTPAPTEASPKIIMDEEKLNHMQFEEKDAHGERRYVSDPQFRARVLAMREQLQK